VECNEIERTDPQLEALEQIGSKLSARFRNVSEEFAPFRTEVVGILKKIRNYKNRKDH
jgi:hypothetical protein